MELWHTLIIEGHLPADQDVENDPKAPHVHLWASILSCLEQFGGGKIQTATEGLEKAPRREQVAETEVNDLDVAGFADKDVLDLQVTVHDAIPMAVIQRTCNLAGKLSGLLLLQFPMGDDIIEHLTAVDEFEQHIPVIIGPDHISHATDIRMIDETDDGGLAGRPNFL